MSLKYTICLLLLSIASLSFGQEVLFFGDQKSNTLNKLNINNGEVSVIAENQHVIRRVKVDHTNQKVYWTEGHQGGIFRSDFDGSNQEKIVNSNYNISVVVLDEVKEEIYFTEYGTIKKCKYNGSEVQTLMRTTGRVLGIEVDQSSNSIFWTENKNKVLKRANLGGDEAETIFESTTALFDLVLDRVNEHVYFSDRTENKIQRIDYNGTNLTEIVQVAGRIGSLGINLESKKLSWIERDNGIIGIADLNGDNRTELVNLPVSMITGQDIVLEKLVLDVPETVQNEVDFTVFPNPASTYVNVRTNYAQEELNVIVYDYQGKLVFSKEIDSGNSAVDCSQLTSGVYLFKFMDGDNSIVQTKEVVFIGND